MRNTLMIAIAAVLGGTLLGAAGMFFFRPTLDAPVERVTRDIVTVPKVSLQEAERLRDDRFAAIESVEDTLALPTDFVQTEALYVLAGRSDSGEVQDLIYQANRIANGDDREAALRILFLRLTELDAPSALALSRTDTFSADRGIEYQVWYSWSKTDLDGALRAAKAESSAARRNLAAQSMYAAHGVAGNDAAERITADLGTSPSRNSRAQYIYRMIVTSPQLAFDFVNDLSPGPEKEEYVGFLAYYISQRYPDEAEGYADLLDEQTHRQSYLGAVGGTVASSDPRRVLDELLTGSITQNNLSTLGAAASRLAEQDIDSVIEYFHQIQSRQGRQVVGNSIVSALLKTDVPRAIAWASENDRGQYPVFLAQALQQAASSDPAAAIAAAEAVENRQQRQMLLSSVLATVAGDDVQAAIAYLDRVTNKQELQGLATGVVSQWAAQDADAALTWLLGNDALNSEQLLMQVGFNLMSADVDAAIRALPRLSDNVAIMWRQQIVQTLASQRSVASAQAFVRQFEDTDEYAELQRMLINSVAQTDINEARQLARQITDQASRDAAFSQLIAAQAYSDPYEAASMLDSIVDDLQRADTLRQLVREWAMNDPDAAQQWTNTLPNGAQRDDAIAELAGTWFDPTPSQRRLIDSISDLEKRAQAQMAQISSIAQRDWRKAQAMLAASSLNQLQRQEVQQYIEYFKNEGR